MSGGWAHFEDAREERGFCIIQNAVLRSPRVSLPAKSVYAILKSFAWQDDVTYPGVKTLCEAAAVSKDALGKYIKELIAVGLIEVKRRGQGKTNLYIFKDISTFLDGDTGSHQDGDTGSHQDGDTGSHNEDSVDEDSDTSTSRRDGKPSKHGGKPWFTILCERYAEVGLIVTEEDRDRLPGNLLRLPNQHDATECEMYQVINHLVSRRRAGKVLSPQEALNDCRGLPGADARRSPPSGPQQHQQRVENRDTTRGYTWIYADE